MVLRVYYVVWWSGRWLSTVDDPPPPGLNTSLQSMQLISYTGAMQDLLQVRSILIRQYVLSVGSVADLLTAIRQAWMSINSSVSNDTILLSVIRMQ